MTKSEEKLKTLYESQGWKVLKKGFPDFFLYKINKHSQNYKFCWREIKHNPNSKINPHQKECFKIFKKLGWDFKIDYYTPKQPYVGAIPIIGSPTWGLDEKKKRNVKIKQQRAKGLSYEKIGKIFGITRQRAHQIVKR